MFPLATGKGVKFNATRTVRQLGRDQPVTVQEDWRCEVAGTASVATQAGNFQTWRVDCAMHETPAVTGNGVLQRSFYYAPDIGFYVRTEERIGNGPTHEADLSSYTTSDPILTTRRCASVRSSCSGPWKPSPAAARRHGATPRQAPPARSC